MRLTFREQMPGRHDLQHRLKDRDGVFECVLRISGRDACTKGCSPIGNCSQNLAYDFEFFPHVLEEEIRSAIRTPCCEPEDSVLKAATRARQVTTQFFFYRPTRRSPAIRVKGDFHREQTAIYLLAT